ncbi:uncharacterized protein LOC117651587 [Thrips palmi]|uniref:Uncharacterized protein LOC117651587 n=1 Tax=Thrips palmi TaxID=161013 RepID=A0A6P9A2X4_THRPL|nr:uncharacterized protein LOC117651587 [Thrips palmi]
MSSGSSDGNGSLRRSKRNQKMEPEYEPFDNPELTLKKATPKRVTPKTATLKKHDRGTARVGSDLNGHTKRKQELESERHMRRHISPLIGFEHLDNQANGQTDTPKIRDGSIENTYTSSKRPFTESETLRNNRQTRSSNSKPNLIAFLTPVFLLSLYVLICMFSKGDTSHNLKSLFPQQSDRLWGFVSHGMDDSNPFVLLLVHSGQPELANCLGRHIAKKVVWGRTKQSTDPIIVEGRNEHSNLLLTLKPQMEKHHALVLQNIEYLDGDVANKLHFILDTYEPWIPGGVYVLTLHVPNIKDNLSESFSTIRTFLQKKWRLNDDVLDPLIARICNFEYVVKNDLNPCK